MVSLQSLPILRPERACISSSKAEKGAFPSLKAVNQEEVPLTWGERIRLLLYSGLLLI
jgi:hypothetical protein